jgi:GT2 family glycosyltransferase
LNVTVVVGNYEGEAVLEDCLASLERQTDPPFEVIVADASSTDGSRAIAERHGSRWLELPNHGIGYLYNRGAEAATTNYVLLSNNDVAYDEQCIELLRRALDADESLFAADPRQMDWTGTRRVHARTTLRRGRMTRELLPGLHLELAVAVDGVMPTVAANGAAMLVRRSMFTELGGFDETFFMDVEDLDLCWRAWLRGHGSVYVPHAWLRHRVGGVTTEAALPKRLSSSHHNLMRFALKCLPVREASLVIAGELARLPRHPRAIAPAMLHTLRELPEIIGLRRELSPSRELLFWMLAGQPGWTPGSLPRSATRS